jgi:pimeloyl-ACP methyl ester carboxylesterase
MTGFLSVADHSLAYQRQVGDQTKPGIFFLGGFGSDMTGTKAGYLAHYCAENNLSFACFDYRGCGQSSGNFADGSIGAWFEDSCAVFDHLTSGPQLVIGSSMGGWLALLLAKARPQHFKALIGVAAAPDFTEDLIWKKLTPAQRETMLRDGKLFGTGAVPNPDEPLTMHLIEDGRQHLVLRSPLAIPCPIRLIHGTLDDQVPVDMPQRIAGHVTQHDTRIIYVPDGDHRLNRSEDLAVLARVVGEFV